jgi:hypothetical protein
MFNQLLTGAKIQYVLPLPDLLYITYTLSQPVDGYGGGAEGCCDYLAEYGAGMHRNSAPWHHVAVVQGSGGPVA